MKVRLVNEAGYYKDLFTGDKASVKDFLQGLADAKTHEFSALSFDQGFAMGYNLVKDKSESYMKGFMTVMALDITQGKIEVVE